MILGITGGIGSGKSYICSLLKKQYGAVIFDCDSVAKEIMNTNTEVIQEIKDSFGKQSYKEGVLDRKYLANIVFDWKPALINLMNIVHPHILKRFKAEKEKNHKLLVIESAILFETGWNKYVDRTLWVDAPIDVRKERVMRRDNFPFKQFAQRNKYQNKGGENRKKADYVFINDGREIKNFFLELFMPL